MHRFPLRIVRTPYLSTSLCGVPQRVWASAVTAQNRMKTTKAVIFDLGGVVVPSPLAAFQGIGQVDFILFCDMVHFPSLCLYYQIFPLSFNHLSFSDQNLSIGISVIVNFSHFQFFSRTTWPDSTTTDMVQMILIKTKFKHICNRA